MDANIGSNSYDGLTSEVSGSNGPWKSITYAATQAVSGDTINIAAGLYKDYETFPISYSASTEIIGAGKDLTTVEGNNSCTIFQLSADSSVSSLSIQGFSGSANYCGIYISGNHVNISDARILGGGFAASKGTPIYFDGANGTDTGGKVTNCEV
ncbi:MAG: DUF1565 domain-containing protein, partial [Candidatus Saganbacteria bacterium]|nr:DUF1565 domain-containing protein [Candidatus Saganbacteria bacterium]